MCVYVVRGVHGESKDFLNLPLREERYPYGYHARQRLQEYVFITFLSSIARTSTANHLPFLCRIVDSIGLRGARKKSERHHSPEAQQS